MIIVIVIFIFIWLSPFIPSRNLDELYTYNHYDFKIPSKPRYNFQNI